MSLIIVSDNVAIKDVYEIVPLRCHSTRVQNIK